MAKITPKPGIQDISLYVGGESQISGRDDVIKLSSNENPLGPSPKAVAAYQEAAKSLHLYPSSDHSALRKAIAEVHGLKFENIIIGCGSDELISFLCRCFAGVGDEVLYTEHGFGMYKIAAQTVGATPVAAPENNRVTDVDALLAACNERTKLVFIANPNNPTGTMTSAADIIRLADSLPEQAILVLDGAYAEYVEGFDGGASLAESRDNVVMTRTFSKIYGLGSLRIGWGYSNDAIMDALFRMRGPFNVSTAALAAAEAAVRDRDYVEYCRAENAKWRDWLAAELDAIGIPSDPSFANFILARFRSEDEVAKADAKLREHGVIARLVPKYNLPKAIRITIGDESGCRRVVEALKEFRKEVG
jgi:histidinol-phosphate aminotransferase